MNFSVLQGKFTSLLMATLGNVFSTWGNSRVQLFLSTCWCISLSLVAFGHSWYGEMHQRVLRKSWTLELPHVEKLHFHNLNYHKLWCIRHLAKPIWFVLRHPIHGSRKCIRLNGPISFMDFFWQNGLGEDINFARLQILAKWPRAPYFAGRNVPPSSHATTLGSLWGTLCDSAG